MGLRFFRRMRIAPGVTLNLSKSGVSASVGTRGACVTVGPRDTRQTIGLPGSGVYWTEQQSWRARAQRTSAAPPAPRSIGGIIGWLIVLFVLLLIIASCHAASEQVCDMQGQCYSSGPPSPNGPSIGRPDPRHFDVRSTNRTDCDETGCPPIGPTVRPITEPPGAAPIQGPLSEPWTAPQNDAPEAVALAPPPYPSTPPIAAYAASQPRECAFARHAIYVSVAQLFAAHRLCDQRPW
jgi:hypothetical protein